jgi:hypothetical protein
MDLTSNNLLLYVTFVLLVIVSIRAISLRGSISKHIERHEEMFSQLERAHLRIEKLEHIERQYNTFSTDLEQAARTSKAQTTPRILNQNDSNSRPPERYKYIHSLTQQGIPAAEIAKILTISSHEADQLVALANISNR